MKKSEELVALEGKAQKLKAKINSDKVELNKLKAEINVKIDAERNAAIKAKEEGKKEK